MVILIYQYNVNICVYFALQHEKLLDFGEDRCLLNSIFCAIHFACELIGVVILLQELCRTLCERCRFPQECESCMQLVRISYPSNRANQRSKQVNFEEKTISWLFLMNLFLSYTVIAKLPGRYLYSVHISQISRNSIFPQRTQFQFIYFKSLLKSSPASTAVADWDSTIHRQLHKNWRTLFLLSMKWSL